MPTESEALFVELCGTCGITWDRIAEAADNRRPDYEIRLDGHRVVVEVKQFDSNDEELEIIAARALERFVPGGTKPGDRIRKAIHTANPQLRARSGGTIPAMLVVYNNDSSTSLHTDHYSVATAMHGLDIVPVLVPADPSITPSFQAVRSGPGRKMTENTNTTISAIGVLVLDCEGRPHLEVFHNRFARHPLAPDWARTPAISHWRVKPGSTSSLDGWERA